MKTLALANGDLVVGPHGHQTLTGAQKIRQDLALALGEPYGGDRFHPTWGSTVPSYIGMPIDSNTRALIETEVSRVLSQYIAVRDEIISEDQRTGGRSRFSTGDVVARVDQIAASQDFDTIRVQVSLTTLAGTRVVVNRTVSN